MMTRVGASSPTHPLEGNVEGLVLSFYQLGTHKARKQLVLRLLYGFCVCLYIRTYHMRNICYYATVILVN